MDGNGESKDIIRVTACGSEIKIHFATGTPPQLMSHAMRLLNLFYDQNLLRQQEAYQKTQIQPVGAMPRGFPKNPFAKN